MGKKNDKKLCWNCDGSVSLHLMQCPYCGVDLSTNTQNDPNAFSSFSSISPSNPFSPSANFEKNPPLGHPFQKSPAQVNEGTIPQSPYASGLGSFSISNEEWKDNLSPTPSHPIREEELEEEEEEEPTLHRRELLALLLLLPGVVFFLFGLVLLFFSEDGVLSLEWNQSFAYFYFLGAIPLLLLGWRSLK